MIKLISVANLALIALFTAVSVHAASGIDPEKDGITLQIDRDHVRTWERFVDALLVLHEENLQGHEVEVRERIGGYSTHPRFFREVTYIDKEQNAVLSRLQWEREHPDNLHLIEVFVRDDNGRVIEDYLAAYLPEFRNAPIQTLINLHHYNGKLHAYRQFDASGQHIYEQCKGHYQGKPVMISLEEDQFITPQGDTPAHMTSAEYQACFAAIDLRVDDHIEMLFAYAGDDNSLPAAVMALPTDTSALQQRIRKYDQLLFKDPTRANLYVLRADAYLEFHQFEKAIEDYTQALSLDDSRDDAYFGRGMAYGRNAQMEEAINDLSVYIERNPQSSLAYTKRGVRYIWKGDLDKAQSDLSQAIKLNPKNAEAHDDLGVIYAQRGQLNQAMEHFEAALRFDPQYQKAYHNKAMVLYSTQQYSQALESVEKALLLDRQNRNSLLLKATIYEAMGNEKAAQQIFEEAEFLPEGNWTERFSAQ